RRSVDLPAPLGPRTAVICPEGNSALTPLSTEREPKAKLTSRARSDTGTSYRQSPNHRLLPIQNPKSEIQNWSVPSPMPHTVALTGASGFVGRWITRELLARGHSVRGLVRDRARARLVLPGDRHLTLVEGDIAEHARVDQLLEGATACINLLGILRESRGQGD